MDRQVLETGSPVSYDMLEQRNKASTREMPAVPNTAMLPCQQQENTI